MAHGRGRTRLVCYIGFDMWLPDPASLASPLNRRVLHYVRTLSAHSDVVDELLGAVKPLGDVQLYCPDPQSYRYVVAATGGVTFALAIGMRTVGFRLDEEMATRALETGGEPLPECGEHWVAFTLFRHDWPAPDLRFWARQAYRYARTGL